MCLWLLQLQLHCLGLHWVEVYGASYTSVGRIAVCACYFLPVACLVLVVNLPRVWHLAAAPWLVIIPVYGAGLNLLSLWEGVGYPLGGVLLRPPVAVRDGAVVLIGWYQTVGDAALGWNRRRELHLCLRCQCGWS